MYHVDRVLKGSDMGLCVNVSLLGSMWKSMCVHRLALL